MEKIKTIRGAQYPPSNNVQPECIKVCKVYDWTILSSTGWGAVTIASGLGNACALRIDECIADPNCEVTVQCTVVQPPTPAFLPCGVSSTTNECNALCNATVVRQGVTVQGSNQAAIVKLVQSIPVTVTVLFNGVADPACPPVTATITISESTVLCLPVPLTKDNVSCRVFDITCDASCIIVNGDARVVNVDISLCKDVRVETEVVLEVAAKFCQPRLPITPPTNICNVAVPFPPQCGLGFFPIDNCTCQANVAATTAGVTAVIGAVTAVGTATITGSVCPNCTLAQSSLNFAFDAYLATDDFSFQANQGSFTQPVCTFDAVTGSASLTTTGTGTVSTPTGTIVNVPFTLTLNSVAGVTCTYTLILAAPFVASVTATIPCTGLTIRDCVKLNEF